MQPRGGRSPAPEESGERTRRRRRWVVAAAIVPTVAAVLVLALVAFSSNPRSPSSARRVANGTPIRATTTTSTTVPVTTTTTDPGTLPQTDAVPTDDSPDFEAAMSDLWSGIVTDSVERALPSFFPESAYLQVKAIPDPAADWQDRLVAEFAQDLAAAHALVASDGAGASLLGVEVPSEYAHWVPPDVCENSVGYYEVADSRVLYTQGGETRSFGIASMISWRGEWYVVHLGAIVRSSDQGVVDDPQPGPGSSAPSTSC